MQQYRLRETQQGAIGIMSAITLVIIVVMLALVIDSSRLYLERRNLQRVADLAALEAASRGGICSVNGQMTAALAQQAASQSAQRNGFSPTSPSRTLQSRVGMVVQDNLGKRSLGAVQAGKPVDAVEVTVSHRIPSSVIANIASLVPGSQYASEVNVTASATAQRMAQASFSVSSGLLSLVSNNSPLLNPIINGLLDSKVDLDVLTPQGIAAANVSLLEFLELLKTRAKVGSIEQLLKTDIGVLPFVSVIGEVVNQRSTVNTKLNTADFLKVGSVGVTLGELLGIASGTSREALKTNVNLLEILTVGSIVANGTNAVNLDVDLLKIPNLQTLAAQYGANLPNLPALNQIGSSKPLVNAKLKVTELPKFAYGPPGKGSNGQWLTQAKTGQVDLLLSLNSSPLNLLKVVANLVDVELDMVIKLGLAQGQAALKSITCGNPAVVTLEASAATDKISLTDSTLTKPAVVKVRALAGILKYDIVRIEIGIKEQALLGTKTNNLSYNYNVSDKTIGPNKTQRVSSDVMVQIPQLEAKAQIKLYESTYKCVIIVDCLVGNLIEEIVNATVAFVINTLGGLTYLVNAILNVLSKILIGPILTLLGINLGYADVTLHGVDQIPAQLVR